MTRPLTPGGSSPSSTTATDQAPSPEQTPAGHSTPGATKASRRGAALILAVIVLTGLLLLALPFLYSQSLARSGAKTFQAQQSATQGRDTSFDLALGLGGLAHADHLADAARLHSVMDLDLNAATSPGCANFDPDLPSMITVDVDLVGGLDINDDRPGATRYGIQLVDEHGKIDVNDLDETMWQALGFGDAEKLAYQRFVKYHRGRPQFIEHLDELRIEYDQDGIKTGSELLSAEEVARLKNHVTAYGMPQARERMIDLGSIIHAGKRVIVNVTNDPPVGAARVRVWLEGGEGEIVSGPKDGRVRRIENDDGTYEYRLRRRRYAFWVSDFDYDSPAGEWLDENGDTMSGEVDLATPSDQTALRLDGPGAERLAPGCVVVLDDPDKSEDERRLRVRLDDSYEFFQDSIGHAMDHDDIQENPLYQLWDDFTSSFIQAWRDYDPKDGDPPPPPIAIALEVPHAVNVHHASKTVLDVLEFTDDLDLTTTTVNEYAQMEEVYDRLGFLIDEATDNPRFLAGLNLRSWGTIGLTGRTTAGDIRDRVVSSSRIAGIAQVGCNDVRTRWRARQIDFELARRREHLAGLVSGPVATTRYRKGADGWQLADLDAAGDARPEPVDTFFASAEDDGDMVFPPNMTPRPGKDLILPLRWPEEAEADIANPRIGYGDTPEVTPTIAEIATDGVDLAGALAYKADFLLPGTESASTGEVDGRQFTFWFKPKSDWSGTTQPIVELRAPADNCLPQLDDLTDDDNEDNDGSPEYQNLWRLEYQNGWVVLYLAGPGIEHTSDASRRPATAGDDIDPSTAIISAPVDDPDTLYFNEESLGSDGDAVPPLTPAQPFNRVEYRYYVGDYLEADRWYHLTVSVSHDRPGGQAVYLDGIAGRDAAKLDADASLLPGDHLTLPCVVLDQDLDAPKLLDEGKADALSVDSITLRLTNVHDELGLELEDVLPERGIVLIGNEYISYGSIDGNSLKDCFRALRANTNTDAGNPEHHWPILEAHPAGQLVLPSGYRATPSGLEIRKGKVDLIHALGSGDTRDGGGGQDRDDDGVGDHKWRVWGTVTDDTDAHEAEDHYLRCNPDNPDQSDSTSPWCIIVNQETVTITYTDRDSDDDDYQVTVDPITSIVLSGQDDQGFTVDAAYHDEDSNPDDITFPARGIVVLNKDGQDGRYMYWYYGARSIADDGSLTMTNLVPLNNNSELTDQLSGLAGTTDRWIIDTTDSDYTMPELWLISLEVDDDTDITDDDYFDQNRKLIQIQHRDTRRVEWIKYDGAYTLSANDGYIATDMHMFLDGHGWTPDGCRGKERTVFEGEFTAAGGAINEPVFPAGSEVLPVQHGRHQYGHWLYSGDVITLLKLDAVDNTFSGAKQVAVRFASTDGYVNTANQSQEEPGRSHDTINEYYAFTEQVDWDYDSDNEKLVMLCGLGWSGYDLSALDPISVNSFRKGYLPLRERMEENCYLFSSPGSDPGGSGSQMDCFFDTVLATEMPGAIAGTNRLGHVTRWVVGDAEVTEVLADAGLGFYVKVDDANMVRQYTGLIAIGGEVFAYSQDTGNHVFTDLDGSDNNTRGRNWIRIIGRGLLGSEPVDHRITHSKNGDDDTCLVSEPVLPLPFGPVEELDYRNGNADGRLSPDYAGTLGLRSADLMDAPLIMVLDPYPDRDQVEFITTAGRVIYPWMRGLYNTGIQDWSAATNADYEDFKPLLIAWWPRWPSALHRDRSAALDDDEWSAAIRCRRYMSASFGLGLRRIDAFGASHTLLPDGGTPGFTVEARALAEGFDWTASRDFADFDSEDGIDGVEYRLNWHYSAGTEHEFLNVIRALNDTPPGLQQVDLSGSMPCILLERGDAR